MGSDEIAHLIEVLSATPRPSSRSLPLPEGRENFRDMFRTVAPRGSSTVAVTDVAAAGMLAVGVRVYRPIDQAAGPQISVYAHGGGWVFGDLDTHDGLCRTLAETAGHIVVSVAYRPSPEAKYPEPVDDVVNAAKWALSTFDVAGISCVLGDSAGGLLATLAAQRLLAEGVPVQAQVLICPALDPDLDHPSVDEFADDPFLSREEMRWYWQQFLPDDDAKADVQRKLSSWPDGIPSTLVLSAEQDILRDEAEQFAQRLSASSAHVVCRRFTGMVHGFPVMAGELPTGAAALGAIGEWMRGTEDARTFTGGDPIV